MSDKQNYTTLRVGRRVHYLTNKFRGCVKRSLQKAPYVYLVLLGLNFTPLVFTQVVGKLEVAPPILSAHPSHRDFGKLSGPKLDNHKRQVSSYPQPFESSLLLWTTNSSYIPSPPASLAVTLSTKDQIQLQWGPSNGATYYQVERRQNMSEDYQVIAMPAATSFADTDVDEAVSYLYRVRAVDSLGVRSNPSNARLATAITFTDNPLLSPTNSSGTIIKAKHVTELRTAINAVRVAANLPHASWAHPNLDRALMYAVDVEELRLKLNEALQKIGFAPPTYTDTQLQGVIVQRVHIQELRSAVNWGGMENIPPFVGIVTPSNNSVITAGATIQISADASDNDGSISRVEFYQGDTKLGEAFSTPYSIMWSGVTLGNHSLMAKAFDDRGASTSSSVAITVRSNYYDSRLDPDNATGQPGEDPLSRNFNWNAPLVELPGRSGHDLELPLTYNSLVWTRDASGGQISYDVDQGFPSPGFRLGFPVIEPKYLSPQTGKYTYLMIKPSGSHVELRQIGTTSTYEAVDSSYLELEEGSPLVVRTSAGTQMQYDFVGGVYQCTEIKDRNGNIISIGYVDGRLSVVTDTVGRVISFSYDSSSGRLSSIKQRWLEGSNNVERVLVSFSYAPQTIQTGLSGITVLGPANGSQLSMLKAIAFADSTSFEFVYNGWGQVYQIKRRAADGHELSRVTYTMDSPTQDCPRLTERRDYAENWNEDQDAVTTFTPAQTETWQMPDDGGSFTGRVAKVTLPDSTIVKSYYPSSGWDEGLAIFSETIENSTTRKWNRTKWTQDNEELGHRQNPRVKETITGEPQGGRKRSIITYQNFELPEGRSCHLAVDVAEADATTILRHTKTIYNLNDAYTSRRIIGLPDTIEIFEGAGEGALLSKVSNHYDEPGYLADQPNLIQHNDGYTIGFVVGRGNITGVQRWDIDFPTIESRSVTTRTKYNTAGSVTTVLDPLNHEKTISYDDDYTGPGALPNTFAFPTRVKDALGFSTTNSYDYLSGAITKTRDPLGEETITEHDSTGRVVRTTIRDGFAHTDVTYSRVEYLPSGTETRTYELVDVINGVSIESFSLQKFDGQGRVIGNAKSHPSSTSGYSAVKMSYDSMGRRIGETNPAEISDPRGVSVFSWNPSGDDALIGWQWTRQSFDWAGRPTITNYADGRSKQVSYSGCGCTGNDITTLIEDAGRTKRLHKDVFGRPAKTEVLDSDGSIYSAAVNIYNARDQIIFVREYKGAATADGSCPANTCRENANTYDGHGRVSSVKAPSQARPTKYTYNPDDTISSLEDSRGVTLTNSYDERHLIKKMTYVVPNDPATGLPYASIPSAPTVEFGYDAAGNRRTMSDGMGWVDYIYDSLGQLRSETRYFSELGGMTSGGIYKLEYEYNRLGEVKTIKDPFGRITYGYNAAGELNKIEGDAFAGVSDYVKDVKYRAWGSVKEITYGNNLKSSTQYDTGLRLKHFEITGATSVTHYGLDAQPAMAMNIDYDYYADGRLRFADDKVDNRFDRAYEYDHFTRLKETWTDVIARKFFDPSNTEALRPAPYRQSYRYDEWGNLTSRTSQFWSAGNDSFAAQYDSSNHITDSQWQYDAAGRETRNSSMAFRYDAAGNTVDANSVTGEVNNQQWFDGDGQILKRFRTETSEFDGQTFTSTDIVYYLRSSVVQDQVLVELAPWGGRKQGYVYNGTTVIAVQSDESVSVMWQHRAPHSGSHGQSRLTGQFVHESEPDPSGVNVQLTDPFIVPQPIQNDLSNGALFVGGSGGLGNCSVDGMRIDCAWAAQMMESGAAVPCPNNFCGPRWDRHRDGPGLGGFVLFAPTADPNASPWKNFGGHKASGVTTEITVNGVTSSLVNATWDEIFKTLDTNTQESRAEFDRKTTEIASYQQNNGQDRVGRIIDPPKFHIRGNITVRRKGETKGKVWIEYNFLPSSWYAIGKRTHVRAYAKKNPGVGYLDLPDAVWWPGLNDWWIKQIAMSNGFVIVVSSDRHKQRLGPRGFEETVFGREYRHLTEKYYYFRRKQWLCPVGFLRGGPAIRDMAWPCFQPPPHNSQEGFYAE